MPESVSSSVTWRKSSHSNPQGAECVEVAVIGRRVHLRDSKDPSGPRLVLSAAQWRAFLGRLRDDR